MSLAEDPRRQVLEKVIESGKDIGRAEALQEASDEVLTGAADITGLVSNPIEAQQVLQALTNLAIKILQK